jgi:hypothetical protein
MAVTSPAGSAVSGTDVFVPPAPFHAADVAFTARLGVAVATTATVATANKVAQVYNLGEPDTADGATTGAPITAIFAVDGTGLPVWCPPGVSC